MALSLIPHRAPAQMREDAARMATTSLLQGSCFLSPERARHAECRDVAREMLGFTPDAGDNQIIAAINRDDAFPMAFYCRGAAGSCAKCGGLIGPGRGRCPECGQVLEVPVGLLAKPEWELRLTTEALQVAVTTTVVADDFLTFTMMRTVRLFVLRNLLSQSEQHSWQSRAAEIRDTVLNVWPEDRRPDKDTWQARYLRMAATFWIVVWPMLEKHVSLDTVDGWTSRMFKAVTASGLRWHEAQANPALFGPLVAEIIASADINHERAIQALSPADLVEIEEEDDQPRQIKAQLVQRATARAVVLPVNELIFHRGVRIYDDDGQPFLVVPLGVDEDGFLAEKGVRVTTIEAIIQQAEPS